MTNKVKNIVLIMSVLLFLFLFLKIKYGKDENVKIINGKPYQVLTHIVDTQYVTKTNVVYREGGVIYRDKPIYVEVPLNVDTNQILREYYSKVVYYDTFKLPDDIGFVHVKDTISQNSILFRKWSSEVKKIIIKDSIIVEKLPRSLFYIGGIGGVILNVTPYIGPSASLKLKNDMIFSVSAGFGVKNTIMYQLGILYPIKF